jgi:hypothetical protein
MPGIMSEGSRKGELVHLLPGGPPHHRPRSVSPNRPVRDYSEAAEPASQTRRLPGARSAYSLWAEADRLIA